MWLKLTIGYSRWLYHYAILSNFYVSSFQLSSVLSSVWLWPHRLQHTRPPCPSPTPRVYLNSYPLGEWCRPTILTSIIPFFPCLQSFPASGSFHMSQLFASGGQSIGVSGSASVLPMSIQGWFPLAWAGWISNKNKTRSWLWLRSWTPYYQIQT